MITAFGSPNGVIGHGGVCEQSALLLWLMVQPARAPRCAAALAVHLCSYGGGDDIRFSRTIVSVDLPAERIPAGLKDRVVAASAAAHAHYAAVPEASRVALLPPALPADFPASLAWSFRFTITSHVRDGLLRCVGARRGVVVV